MVNKHLYKNERLDLVSIAGGEINLNAMFAGALRRYIVENETSVDGLARFVEIKAGIKELRRTIDAIQGGRLKEVSAEDAKIVLSTLGLENQIYLPLVDKWRDLLREEMEKRGYIDFSDKALRQYMTDRILEGICKKECV